MKAARRKDKPRYPSHWAQLPNGELLRDVIEQALVEPSRKLFGYHLLRVGNLSAQLVLPHCPIKHRVNQTELRDKNSQLIAAAKDLPLQENSIDAFVLAHELDFSQDPHQILREVDRTIMPNGYVIITGFNPYSLAGMSKLLPIHRQSILHEARFFSCARIKDWLNLLSFEVIEQQHLIFSDLFFSASINPHSRWHKWGAKYLPFCASIYILIAQKRVMPLSVVKPVWKPQPRFTAIGASMRDPA